MNIDYHRTENIFRIFSVSYITISHNTTREHGNSRVQNIKKFESEIKKI